MKKDNNQNVLNVFTYGYLPCSYLSNIFHNITQFFRNIRYAIQRAVKGYCDQDIWDLDIYYTWLIHNSLIDFKNTLHGYPGNLTEEEWDNILIHMAEHFYQSLEDTDNPYTRNVADLWKQMNEYRVEAPTKENPLHEIITDNEQYEEARNRWLEAEQKAEQYRLQERRKAIEMLGKYWGDLWD